MSNSPKTWAEARAAARRLADSITPDEDARIKRGIEADPDTRELTDQDFQRMKPARGGRPPKPASERKRSVTLRLSPDVIEKYKATGRGWHTRMDEALRREAPQIAPLVAAKEAAVGIVPRAAKRSAAKASRKIARPVAGKKWATKSGSKKSAAKAGSVKTTAAKSGRPSSSKSPSTRSGGRSSSSKR